MPGTVYIWISLLLLCITEGGYEYIHCPKEFTDFHVRNTTCYLNPHCPDKYIYITTVASNEEYHRCKEISHRFEAWPLSEGLYVYWSESEGVDDLEVTIDLILKINAEVTDPVMFMTNFTCSDEHHIRHWAELFVIIIQIIEVHITHMWLDQNQLYIACNSNYMYTDQVYDLYGPNGIIDIECSSDGCQVTLSHPNSGQYHCELELDGELIKSGTVTINITIDIDTPSTQLLITTPPQSVNTTIISLGSVGGLVLVAFIMATILLCAVTILYYRRGRNRYQQLPNGGDGAGGQDGQGAAGADGGGGQ